MRIHDGADTDVVACDVFEVSLDKEPVFEALSYTWDLDPEWSTLKFDVIEDKKKEERPILCNGKTYHVTMNLYHALTEFRRRKWPQPIWADQICINQNDHEEKIAQLAIMVDIYRSAAYVNIWLGKLTMVLNNAIDFIESLPDELVSSAQPTQIGQASTTPEPLAAMARTFDGVSLVMSSISDHYHWINTVRVIGRKWFSRAWTLQEFLVATNFRFLMGGRDISANAFIKAASQLIEFYATDPLSTQLGLNVAFLSLRKHIQGRITLLEERDRYQNGKRYSAEEYLSVIRVRRSTELKDKVIAGSALLEDRVSCKVNYKATTQEIYTTYATEALWPEVGVFALSLVGGTAPSVEGLPTWAPDLSNDLRPEPLRYCGCPVFPTVPALKKTEFLIEGKALRLSIAKWDVVKGVGESIWSWTKYSEESYNSDKVFKMRTPGTSQTERFGLVFALLNKLGLVYSPTGERTIDAFWQTLIGGINSKDDAGMAVWRDRFHQWFAFILLSIRSTFNEDKKDLSNRLIPKASKKKWIVPLIADWPSLEQRVSNFLDFHDQQLDNVDDSELTLRKAIAHISKRIWGTETIDDVGYWNSSVTELLSAVRGEQFYGPISIFGQHFETVFDGRRVLTTEKGFLGTGAEDVRVGDLIVLVDGAEVPYILRPVADKDATFTLVSEAYVHGIKGDLMADSVFEPITII